ncbi:conserved hypothetical protein [Paraburkholderia tropica]
MSDVDLAAIADRLYAASTPATPATPASDANSTPQTEAQAQADTPAEKPQTETPATDAPAQTPELPDAIRELRNDPLRRMFSAQGTFAGVPLEESMQNIGGTPAEVSAIASEWREVFADLGASPNDARELVMLAQQHGANMPADAAGDGKLYASAVDALVRQYGSDAQAALDDARALIARDPRLGSFLDKSRMGNDPRTVLKVVQLARSAKMRGELK